jgi:hypothetical protein
MKKTLLRSAYRTLLGLLLFSVPARVLAGPVPRDAIDLSQAQVYNSPMDIASWPVTGSITQVNIDPTLGVYATSDKVSAPYSSPPPLTGQWPQPPSGDSAGLQYTLWAVVEISGTWYTSGFIEMWIGRPGTGAKPIGADWSQNWAYDPIRWGPMASYVPTPGSQMGFFLSAGNARGETAPNTVRERTNVVLLSLPANETGVYTFTYPTRSTVGDYNGDGRADLAIYSPSTGIGQVLLSGSDTISSYSGGRSTDIPLTGDFDGDGKSDPSAYRPSDGTWYIAYSSTGTNAAVRWGGGDAIPVPGDYDGDGKTDPAVYFPSTGQWWILYSSTGWATNSGGVQWGGGDGIPVPGDYDGDGLTDPALYFPSTGQWWILYSSTDYRTNNAVPWGGGLGIPVPGDYDGDGLTDPAVYDPSTGTWWILYSSTHYGTNSGGVPWGGGGAIPAPADYDGDGKADPTVYDPSTGQWWILNSGTGYRTNSGAVPWGGGDFMPVNKRP